VAFSMESFSFFPIMRVTQCQFIYHLSIAAFIRNPSMHLPNIGHVN
jgi:hypothetical protein